MERISDIDIESLIPQREPMLMVSGLCSASDKSITTWFQVEPGNIFVEKGKFRESGLIENIAQTAAALNGYRARIGWGAGEEWLYWCCKKPEDNLPSRGGRSLNYKGRGNTPGYGCQHHPGRGKGRRIS